MANGSTNRIARAYLTPYAKLCEVLPSLEGGNQAVVVNIDQLKLGIKLLLRGVEVDEEWYQREYRDVKEAISAGTFRSAKHHFVENGYFEGRKPSRVFVDEEWYGRAYSDVSEGLEFGEIDSFQEHFDRYGEKEGRLPSED